jgi:hypothetical protein
MSELWPHAVARLDAQDDPWPYLIRLGWPEWSRTRMLLGARREEGQVVLNYTDHESNSLILGPPRANKTTGFFVSQIVNHVGPRVIMTVKPDLARLTSVVCSRSGPVMQLDATAEDPIPGVIPTGWSLIDEAPTWAKAQKLGALITASAEPAGDNGNHAFWGESTQSYIAVPFYAANIGKRDMRFVMRCFRSLPSALDEMEDILKRVGTPDADEAMEEWESIHLVHAEALGSIRLTARHALRIFNRPEVRAQADNPNLDLHKFVRGMPDCIMPTAALDERTEHLALMGIPTNDGWPQIGAYPTLFITASTTDAEEAQTIYRAFMRRLRDEVFAMAKEDERNGVVGRRKVLLVCDELANLAPDPAYPSMVSQSADQGLLISSGLQDLGQVERHFGRDANSFLTVHREVIVFPGIRNPKTITDISTFLGQRWETLKSHSSSANFGREKSTGVSSGDTHHRLPTLDPGEIYAGKPGDPKAVLSIPPNGDWEWIWPTPVWGARPFPRLLIASLERCTDRWMGQWIGQPGTYPVWAMPVPDLGRCDPADGVPWLIKTQRDGAALLARWQAVKARYGDDGESGDPSELGGPSDDSDDDSASIYSFQTARQYAYA